MPKFDMPPHTPHQPVMLSSVLALLAPKAGETYLDLTAGYGGHARAIAKKLGPHGQMVLVDRDQAANRALKDEFTSARVLRRSYLDALKQLKSEGFRCNLVLLDLGVSSPQLEQAGRGFSFRAAGPLDMRMDSRQHQTAAELVNSASERELADLIYRYGEERRSRQIASAIVANRPLRTTTQLAEVVAQANRTRGRIHPATRTFQALRIAVNDELNQLEAALPIAFDLLESGGRLAAISFHSLEDRIVKRFCQARKAAKEAAVLTKKPLSGRELDAANPRARSAKLRALQKSTH